MKTRIYAVILTIISVFCIIFTSSCAKKSRLLPYVSELRENIYHGGGEKYSLNAYYGFKENPYINDGKVGPHFPTLTFILKGAESEETAFFLEFPHLNQTVEFEKTSTGNRIVTFNVENFHEKEFPVSLIYSSEHEAITMYSLLGDGVLDINGVLTAIEKNQPTLINSYFIDLEFCAEIYARIIVRNNKTYWYIAFGNGNTLKAFLVDGVTGKTLAIREVL